MGQKGNGGHNVLVAHVTVALTLLVVGISSASAVEKNGRTMESVLDMSRRRRLLGDESKAGASQGVKKESEIYPLRQGLCMYTITTVTGRRWGAGTDSSISLALYNRNEDRAYFPVLDNGNNNFEKGKVDTFLQLAACVEDICKMILSTDNSGMFSDWYVETLGISVTTPSSVHEERTWELHQWLPATDKTASLFILKDNCTTSIPT